MITDHFKLDYKITGQGWAVCDVEVGEQKIVATASYLDDAFGQLVCATLLLRQGAHMSGVSFPEEPGEYRWMFEKTPGESGGIRIRVWFFEELWSYLPETDEKKILDGVVQAEVFYRALLSMIENVFAEYGEEGYKERWNGDEMPFPMALYNELARLIDEWPGRQ
ncbi:MAG: hypothetical protein AB8C13_09315 [Phycisphaerales bacterium]